MRETVSNSRVDRNQSLLSGNKLKLAVFGANVSGGCAMTSATGIDGITLSWVDYESGLEQFQKQILPLMRQAGLRQG